MWTIWRRSLARLRLISLDLYECPVTRARHYRSRVLGMIRTLKYLDKLDADENEGPESDDDDGGDGEGGEEGEEDDDDDPGSGKVTNGGIWHSWGRVEHNSDETLREMVGEGVATVDVLLGPGPSACDEGLENK
jgi:hypothetical protein